MIKCAFADPRLGADILHAGSIVPGNSKPSDGCIQDARPRLFTALLHFPPSRLIFKISRSRKHTDWSVFSL
jgi:hypothetical protein